MTRAGMACQPAGASRWQAFMRSIPGPLVALLLAVVAAGLSGLDRLEAEAVRAHAAPWLIQLAKDLSRLGQSECYIVPTLLLLLWWWRVRPDRRLVRVCFWLLAAEAAGGLVTRVLKIACGRWRPSQLASGHFGFAFFSWKAKMNAFPSGHATDAMAVALVLWFVCPRLRPLCVAWVVMIAAARMLALDHFPSDVAAGMLVGLLCALALRPWFDADAIAAREA